LDKALNVVTKKETTNQFHHLDTHAKTLKINMMKSHKTTYFVKSDSCEDCMQIIMINRKPKSQTPIRRTMWKAWWHNHIESYNKKHTTNETN